MFNFFDEDLNLVLNETKDKWKTIHNKTFFISGGTGFFGIWLIMSFIFINRKLNLNSKIILLTRNKANFISKNNWINDYDEVSFLEGDIVDFSFIDQEIDFIIHAATDASNIVNQETPLVMFDTIVNGTKRILDFAIYKKIKSFLMISSGAVYGQQPYNVKNVSEDFMGSPNINDPLSIYGESKRMAELLCTVYFKQYKLPVKVARCYTFVGPFLPTDRHFAIGNFINNILNNENIVIEGDGTPIRSYMYSADLTIWLWTILFQGSNNTTYNVGSDKPINIGELAKLVSNCKDSSTRKIVVKSKKSHKQISQYVPNIDKAKEELKLNIYTDLETSIKKTIKYNKLKI